MKIECWSILQSLCEILECIEWCKTILLIFKICRMFKNQTNEFINEIFFLKKKKSIIAYTMQLPDHIIWPYLEVLKDNLLDDWLYLCLIYKCKYAQCYDKHMFDFNTVISILKNQFLINSQSILNNIYLIIIYIFFFQAKLLPQEPPPKNEKVKSLPYYFDDGNYSTMLYIDLFFHLLFIFQTVCFILHFKVPQ